MLTINKIAKSLKEYFLSRRGDNTMEGHLFVSDASTFDLGSAVKPLRAVYADSLFGTPTGFDELVGVQSGDTAGYLDDKLVVGSNITKAILGTTDKQVQLTVNTSTFLLRSGVNSLQGNLSVDSGITIDGVDLSVHVADPNAHHNRLHAIVDAADHSGSGAQHSVIGFTATDTLGVLVTTTDANANPSKILRADATGTIKLTTLVTETKVRTPLIDTATGDLTIDPAGDVVFPFAQEINSDNFSPGFPINGWWIGRYAIGETPSVTRNAMQIYSLTVDELRARTFVVDEVRVDRGEEFITKSYGTVARPFVTPSGVSGTVVVWFEDSPAFSGAIFSNGDYLLFRIFDDSGGGLTIANILFTVSGYTNQAGDFQSWTLTLVEGLTDYEIRAGAVGWDWGQSGQGLIHSSVVDTSGSPYMDIKTWVTGSGSGGPLEGDMTTHVRIGYLIDDLDPTGEMNPDGWGLYSDNAYLRGDLYAAGGNVRILRDDGINIAAADTIPYYPGAINWWYDIEDRVTDPALEIFMYRNTSESDDWFTFAHMHVQQFENGYSALELRAIGTGGVNPGQSAALVLKSVQASGPVSTASIAAKLISLGENTAGDIIQLITPLTKTQFMEPFVDATSDIGSGSKRYKDGYFSGTLHVVGGITGGVFTGAEWEFAGSMIIDANSASNTIVTVTNQGAGRADLAVDRHITVSGDSLIDGVDLSAFKTSYDAHIINASAHHNPVTAGDGISLATQQVSVDSTVVRTTRTLTAGNGLTGGGDLSANRTFTVGAGTLITVGSTTVSLSNGSAQYQVPVTESTPFTPAWTNLSSFAGDGMSFGSGAFHVGQGAGLTVHPDTIALTAPGTLAHNSVNDATGNHTHAITTSAAPTVAVILQSNSSGGLTLKNLTVQGNIDITSSGDLTVGANIFFVDASQGNVGINCAPDVQFDLDVLGNIRAQGWFVGKHAIQVEGAIMIAHYDGPLPFTDSLTGHLEGHMGQVASTNTTPVFREGAFRASKAVEIAEATTNLVTNPEFAGASATGWTNIQDGTASGTRAVVNSPKMTRYSYRIVKSAGADGDNYGAYHEFPVTSGQQYTITAWVNVIAVSGGTEAVSLSTAGDLAIVTSTVNGVTNGWVRLQATATASATGNGRLRVFIDNATTGTILFSNVQAENKTYPTPYTATSRLYQSILYPASQMGAAWLDWDNFSVAFWFYADFAASTVGRNLRLFDIYVDASNRWVAHLSSSTNNLAVTNGTDTLTSASPPSARNWYHCVFTVNGTTLTLYVNGQQSATGTAAFEPFGVPEVWVGFAATGGIQPLNGFIDDFALIDRAMPASEIIAIYESRAPIFAETSTFVWRLPNNLVWGDSEGLWVRTDDGAAAFGISGVNSKSWGNLTLDKGDVLIGNNSGGTPNYVRWDHSAGAMTFVGNGSGVTSISGSNITTGTINASVATITNINASNISTGTLAAARIAAGSLDATKITAGTITATQINGTNLAAIFVDTGSLNVTQTITIGTGGTAGIYQGTGTFSSPTTGLKIWRDGSIGRIGGFNAGTLQWYANTDGKLYAGGGAVKLDSAGITIESPASYDQTGSLKYINNSGTLIAELATVYSGTTVDIDLETVAVSARDSNISITSNAPTGRFAEVDIASTINSASRARIRVGVSTAQDQVLINKNVYIDQSSTTLGDAVLILEQADLSEEFINFIGTVGAGNSIEEDTTPPAAPTHKIRVAVNGAPKYIYVYGS